MRMLVWRKLASAKWEDAWLERLAFLGPTRLCVVALPSQKSLRIEAFNLTRKEGANLVEQFGGKLYEVKDKPVLEPPPRKPLPIRNALLVVDSPKAAEAARRAGEKGPVIIIPAAMAFGTGEHATTASCLRLLADLATKTFRNTPWDFNDLGTGSGILAILLFALVGTLFVIPTAAEIPIIQSFTALGLGAGPAAALLITLPAVSLPSLLMVSRSFPRKVLGFLFASVVILGIVAGIVGAWVR